MSQRPLPAWRSLLFCPASSERFVAKAHSRGADAIILDLEDSVGAAEKASARAGVPAAAASVGQAGADVLVRINRELPWAVQDIAAAVGAGVMGLVLPKVMGPEHVRLLAEVVTARELELGLQPGHTRFVALVESAAALEQLAAIARADARLVAMAVGGEDLATDLQAEPTADTLYVAKMLGLHAARAAGILPLGVLASVAGVGDGEAYRAMLARSRALGFACATCVHPAQVPLLNAAFGPSEQELERARRLIAAYESGLAQGRGATLFEGAMVDKPVADRALRLLARARAA
ncbi:HpcH/HpaI aldolase/citrate lyase family protein [Ramlibacter tataouinensis]|uniref:Citrate lyase beta chain, citryl-CoA lyase subunit-like protein n=1 Tax=Ramlibacter tataouinensis (strain ATCC BAA-407 / DSM 14655 / LMG 21543 / TTB310) TaxID=365046 RepID=F5Y441_RAMTT|nr:CoA ester lyase [Ramlibacter tataouinensis]AEG92506.1 citrate lyase beta chain, citryl-CoA lyase subunit-like protein [Ramlibacter tataouinensis TTB310]